MKLLLFNGYNIDGETEFFVDDGTPFFRNGKITPDGAIYTGLGFNLYAHACGITYLDTLDAYLGPEDWALDQTS